MTTFNFSDITPAGAFANATMAAQKSDRRSADSHIEPGEGWQVTKLFTTLARHIAAAITEIRQTASQPASRPI
jgi:hypothetical protein